jgi:aerotaxis receptor
MSLRDMTLEDTGGTSREVTVTYADGTRRKLLVVDEEVPFPEGRLIVSRTDPEGIITHANESFVRMSGFTKEELMGTPHYILRHPDMPAIAFKGLWDTISQGKKWHGYVKNLRKDGKYYWVHAVVVPNVRGGNIVGYASVRRKPSRSKIAECETLYRKLLAEEVKP